MVNVRKSTHPIDVVIDELTLSLMKKNVILMHSHFCCVFKNNAQFVKNLYLGNLLSENLHHISSEKALDSLLYKFNQKLYLNSKWYKIFWDTLYYLSLHLHVYLIKKDLLDRNYIYVKVYGSTYKLLFTHY